MSFRVSLDSRFTRARSRSSSACPLKPWRLRTKDTGTLQYDIYFNDDQSECVVLERYRDSEALIEHAANLGDLSEAILATVSVVHGELLGEPSAELRAKLAGSEVPHLFTHYQSM
jgi:hypothetical protein